MLQYIVTTIIIVFVSHRDACEPLYPFLSTYSPEKPTLPLCCITSVFQVMAVVRLLEVDPLEKQQYSNLNTIHTVTQLISSKSFKALILIVVTVVSRFVRVTKEEVGPLLAYKGNLGHFCVADCVFSYRATYVLMVVLCLKIFFCLSEFCNLLFSSWDGHLTLGTVPSSRTAAGCAIRF